MNKKKIKIKCYFKKTNEKLDDAMSHTFTKTFFFLSSLLFNLIIFSFSTPQTMGGHPEQIFAFCYESINQFIHASHSFHFHFLLFLFVTLMHFIFTFIDHYHLLTNNPKQGERYPVGYLLIWQHCFIWQC